MIMTIHLTMCQAMFVYEHNNTVRWVLTLPPSVVQTGKLRHTET